MSKFWMALIIISLSLCLFNGDVKGVEEVILMVGQDTLYFVIPLICSIAFFNGILYIAREAGVLEFVRRLMNPLLRIIFPDIKDDKIALGYISSNIIINMFGLGSAATPSGLLAMKQLQKHNKNKNVATRAMVTFLILNTAGVTLFPTNVLALRASFQSQSIASFMPYAMLTTIITSILALLIDRWRNYRD